MQPHPIRGSALRWLYIFWAIALLVPVGISWLLLSWHPTDLAIIIAALATLMALLNWGCAGWLVAGSLSATSAALVVVPLGVCAALSPVAVRAALPWEEPGTGEGSPMAVLIHLVFFTVIFGASFGITGLIGWIWLIRAGDKLVASQRD